MPRHFGHWLKAYCDFTATSEAPLDFHFWTGVSTIASVLRRRVWKDERLFTWTPNFYIILVGPPGVVTKSTTIDVGYHLLKAVPGVHFGPDSMTWHGLAKDFEKSFEFVQYKNGIGKDTPLPMSALTCSVSELGTFLRPDDKPLISFLTDVWDGKMRPFRHTTKDSGDINIEHPWLNVIGATTPKWLQDNFSVSLLSQGIGSRVVFIFGDKKRHFTAYPSKAITAPDYASTQKKLTEDLVEMSKLVGPYDLTPDAYKWGEDWYLKHHSNRAVHVASDRYEGYLGRKQTHLHKLAMILAAAQRDDLLVEKGDLEAALQILEGAEHSMIRVFESVGVVDEAKHIAEIVAYIRAYGWITVNDLYRLVYNTVSEKDFKQAIRIAVDGGFVEVKTQNNQRGLSPVKRSIH